MGGYHQITSPHFKKEGGDEIWFLLPSSSPGLAPGRGTNERTKERKKWNGNRRKVENSWCWSVMDANTTSHHTSIYQLTILLVPALSLLIDHSSPSAPSPAMHCLSTQAKDRETKPRRAHTYKATPQPSPITPPKWSCSAHREEKNGLGKKSTNPNPCKSKNTAQVQ